ncbi:chemokine-like factor isoform X1 [Sarcophilus harrisii]|uniref:chemokine-like factor isoform X1 n=1 Tax=Sarcophilus harrisii TaxID=9305 RepID=UPI00062B57AA|nr:chemokine-like factor isoform X1 [Sarcophilus harrisii]
MESQINSDEERRTVWGFLVSIKGIVKMIRLVLIIVALIIYIVAQAPETYIVITTLEAITVFFFVILYLLRLDLVLKFLFWPLLDIINSLMTIVFLMIVSVLSLIPETKIQIAVAGMLLSSTESSCLIQVVPMRKGALTKKSDVLVTLATLIIAITLVFLRKKMKTCNFVSSKFKYISVSFIFSLKCEIGKRGKK